jgi:hypothetical protein
VPAPGQATERSTASTADAARSIKAKAIDRVIQGLTEGGAYTLLGWSSAGDAIEVAQARAHDVLDALAAGRIALPPHLKLSVAELRRLGASCGAHLRSISLPYPVRAAELGGIEPAVVDAVVRRYALSKVPARACARIEIDGLDSLDPVAQEAQIQCVAHALAIAAADLEELGLRPTLRRQWQGNGVVLWHPGAEASLVQEVALFCALAIALASVEIERLRRGDTSPGPALRAGFVVAEQYEHTVPSEDGPPRARVFGDACSELSWLAGRALPGQILIADYVRHDKGRSATRSAPHRFMLEAMRFLRQRVAGRSLRIAGTEIGHAILYLTGERLGQDTFYVNRYGLRGPDGAERTVFNAKINLRTTDERPLYLGLLNDALEGFEGLLIDRFSIDGQKAEEETAEEP